ncbi:tetratricopeptide repeat protein [Streptomyces sp. NPDC006332]|uniref:tetratricopeptide repeat protein n=1 Tax=Streptomyces sp. NPDC006332 TaxID=3155456 RepID=UPI0033ADD9C0
MPRRTNDSAPASGHPAPPPATPEREHGTGSPAGAKTPNPPEETGTSATGPEQAATPSPAETGADDTPVAGGGESGDSGEADGSAAETDATGQRAEAEADTGAPGKKLDAVGARSAGDPRVVAVRRVSAAGRRWRVAQLAGCAALLAVALTAGAIAVGAAKDGGTTEVASASAALSPELLTSGDIDTSITALQGHLRAQPKDFSGWATLGLAYVEQARTKGDPARYPQAERALKQSLDLKPDNDQALAGRAALAAARHDFKNALTYADRALEQNPYSERALSSRIDALVELGRYDDASKAADTADTRRPGIPVFTRYAYVRELRGDVTTARRVLEQALATATSPGDVAYVSSSLGQLAWNQGDYKEALNHYARALAADENYLPALEGRARAEAADGDSATALRTMEAVVARYPLPGPLVVLGELYEDRGADGDRAKARDQYALVDAWTALARANKVNADLDTALAAADHGDKAEALRAARAEWSRRHTVHTADALAWALHVNGRDEEALPYARRATATGYRNAAFRYHRGMIERATGNEKEARTHLTAALELNPGFSPLGAREARKALKSLEATEAAR